MTSYNGITYNYDNNGNLLSKDDNGSLTNYTWDYENRLTEVVGAGLASARYGYDPFGKRLSKTVDGVTKYYLYDNEDIIVEYNDNGSLKASYLHGQGADTGYKLQAAGCRKILLSCGWVGFNYSFEYPYHPPLQAFIIIFVKQKIP